MKMDPGLLPSYQAGAQPKLAGAPGTPAPFPEDVCFHKEKPPVFKSKMRHSNKISTSVECLFECHRGSPCLFLV